MRLVKRIKKELYEYKRILKISTKPTREEYIKMIKVSSIGIGMIGLLGFLIQLIGRLI